MNSILREFINKCMVVYMDGILVYSKSEEDHVRDVSQVLKVLKNKGLILIKEKCEFGKKKIEVLGHVIRKVGEVDPKMIETIQNMPLPNTKKKLKSFMNLINYCARFINGLHKDSSYLYAKMNNKGEVAARFWKMCAKY
ncbi:Retrovirus-related Pol polyprotein from transposon 17.6 [Nosema granulosis]|uniref:Retrovirus-related Pol polyprotein from transposon 17.6 n=1 Tax=Nosema granulosis TaxID=83296 RepID=A0A9P6KY03_9MICR|nr:Retrovirus-related Pol polyprotein from transposon 17.6 [Nosema granulosis]